MKSTSFQGNVIHVLPVLVKMCNFGRSSLCIIFLLLTTLELTKSERLHGQIYSSIEGAAACFRRLNGTHQAGCSSSREGAVGVVQMVNTVDDAQWIVNNGSAGPYVAVVSTALFRSVVEVLLDHPNNVAGILLYENTTMPASDFTQESRCPNEYYSGPGSQCSSEEVGGIVWNEKGTGLLRRDIPFPIFYLPEARIEEINNIYKCYEKFNLDKDNQQGRPLCSLQLYSFMYAAVNTVVCMRRSSSSALMTGNRVCDALGDNNVFYTLFPRNNETKENKKPVYFVTARIDSGSLFDGVAPGASSSVVALSAFISAAAALSKMIPVSDSHLYERNVLWTLFNGEAFDYIGSQRVAFDIGRGAWPPRAPLAPADLRLHVELGQLGGALLIHQQESDWPLYAFVPTIESNEIIDDFLQNLNKNMIASNLTVRPTFSRNLPPSSLHSFRRVLKNETQSGQLPELLIVDHNEKFTNVYYNSALDNYDKIGFVYRNISIGTNGTFVSTAALLANGTMKESDPQVKIARLATAVARTLYQQVTDKDYVGDIEVSAHLVDEVLYCYLLSQSCRLLMAADYAQSGGGGGEETLPARAASMYVGVSTWPTSPPVFAGHMLALLTGNHLNVNRSSCDKMDNPEYSYYYLRGWNNSGVCIETTMNFSQALSPAFLIPDYDLTSGEYSTWTESVWQTMWARVFVAASGGGARAAAGGGALATAAAAVAVYWLRRHYHHIFAHPAAAATLTTDAAAGILRSVNC